MGLTTIVHFATNKEEYFARRLHNSMAGLGTKDSQLIRLLVTRSTVDLADIKIIYERLFSQTLLSWIQVLAKCLKSFLKLLHIFDFI